MGDVVLGAALGTAFAVLYDAVDKAIVRKSKTFRSLLKALETTLASIQPLVLNQIGDYNVKLELPNDEVEKLRRQMREGTELICRLSNMRWWKRTRTRYIVQLVDLDASLKGLMQLIMMQQTRDVKENLVLAKQTAKQLVQFQEFNEKLLRERTLLQEGTKELQEKFVSQLQNNGEHLLKLQRVIEDMMMQQEVRKVIDTGDPVGVAAVMTLYKVLFKSVDHLSKQNVTYKPILTSIKSTLDSLAPVIDMINESDRCFNDDKERQMHRLATKMQDGAELFSRCFKVGTWNIYKNLSNINKLIKWEESLQRDRDWLIEILDDQHHEQPITAPLLRQRYFN